MSGWLSPRPRGLLSGKGHVILCIGDWIDPRASVDGWGKSRLHRDSIAGLPARSESLYQLSYPGPVELSRDKAFKQKTKHTAKLRYVITIYFT